MNIFTLMWENLYRRINSRSNETNGHSTMFAYLNISTTFLGTSATITEHTLDFRPKCSYKSGCSVMISWQLIWQSWLQDDNEALKINLTLQ